MKKAAVPIAELNEPHWELQPNEPTDWFRRFCAYRNQIGKRSFQAVYLNEIARSQEASEGGGDSGKKRGKRSKNVPGSWDTIFVKWRWKERVEAWDIEKQQDEDREWDDKMQQLRSNRWEQYQTIRAKAETMLRMPLVNQTTTRNDGDSLLVTNINATDWAQFLDAAKFLVIGDQLAEAAVGNMNIAATLLQKAGFKVEPPGAIESVLGFDSDYPELEESS